MRLLFSILSIFGLERWTDNLSSQMQDIMIEGMGAIEARSALIRYEWEEEKIRLAQIMTLSFLCFGLLLAVLLCLSFAIVITFWDSHYRILSVWLIVIFWIFCLFLCIFRIIFTLRKGKEAFKYTKRELSEDWKAIKNQL